MSTQPTGNLPQWIEMRVATMQEYLTNDVTSAQGALLVLMHIYYGCTPRNCIED